MGNNVITPREHVKLRKEFPEYKTTQTLKLKSDVVIIGSGAGGAVAAAELSRNGWQVVLLEEGSYFTPAEFTNDEFLSYARLYRDGGNITVENFSVGILQGRSLGGSTTVNWQTCLYPSLSTTQEWRDEFGLDGYDENEISPYIKEVSLRVGAHQVPHKLINENNSVLARGGRILDMAPEILKNSSRNCIGLGRCGLGCPINAKQSMFLTYIPDALKNGARVISNMRVTKIKDGKKKQVYATFEADPYTKYSENKSIFENIEIEAPVVILSAGAIEGPALLQRSDLGNEWVGRNLKLHPTAAILARYPKKINMHTGPPQSIVIKENKTKKETKDYGFWLEVAPARPASVFSSIPLYGADSFKIANDYLYMHAGIALVRDGADGETQGRVEWEWGKRKVHYTIGPKDGKNLLRGLSKLAQVQTEAGAIELIFPFTEKASPYPVQKKNNYNWILNQDLAPGRMRIFSAHPHGSIQAAASPRQGAIAPNFELYGHSNIFVMDASWYPTGLGVNPQIATMSSVLRASRLLAKEKTERL